MSNQQPTDPTPEPATDLRQRLAAELHRIADAIVTHRLPLNEHMSGSLHLGVLDSRADLEVWAAHLGTTVKVSDNDIPTTYAKIRLDDRPHGADLIIETQTHKDSTRSELEAQATEPPAGRPERITPTDPTPEPATDLRAPIELAADAERDELIEQAEAASDARDQAAAVGDLDTMRDADRTLVAIGRELAGGAGQVIATTRDGSDR